MKKPLRIAVIGQGRWGTRITSTLRTLASCEVAYQVTHDYETLLTKNDIDGIVIATPAATHGKIASAFIKKGLPLFIEKPLTASLKEAQELARLAKKYHSPIFVGHIHRYNSAYIALKAHVKKIAPIRMIMAEGMSNGPFRSDVSVLWDWAPHDLYLMLDLLKKFPKSVQAWGIASVQPTSKHYDTSVIKLTFAGNITAILTNSWVSPEKHKRFTAIGKTGSLVLDDTKPDEKAILYPAKKPQGTPLPYENTLPLTNELSAWLTSIETHKKPHTGIEDGLAVVKILDAAQKSVAKNGAVITL